MTPKETAMTLNEREPVRADVLVEVSADESTARFTAVI